MNPQFVILKPEVWFTVWGGCFLGQCFQKLKVGGGSSRSFLGVLGGFSVCTMYDVFEKFLTKFHRFFCDSCNISGDFPFLCSLPLRQSGVGVIIWAAEVGPQRVGNILFGVFS